MRDQLQSKANNDFWLSSRVLNAALRDRRGPDSWQVRVLRFSHRQDVQWFMIGLLLLDVCVIFAELFIESEFPSCRKIQHAAISCCAASTSHPGGADLIGHSLEHHQCDQGFAQFHEATVACAPQAWAGAHDTHVVLDRVTFSILAVFELEVVVLVVALQDLFCRSWVNVLDLIVITCSLGIQGYILLARWNATHGDEPDLAALEDIQGLVLFGRFWRFVRVGHGIATSMHDMLQTSHAEVHTRLDELRKALNHLEGDLRGRGVAVGSHGSVQKMHSTISEMSTQFHC